MVESGLSMTITDPSEIILLLPHLFRGAAKMLDDLCANKDFEGSALDTISNLFSSLRDTALPSNLCKIFKSELT